MAKSNINITSKFDIIDPEIENAIKKSLKKLIRDSSLIKDICPKLNNIEEYNYELILLPLDRVGAVIGASGSKVFVSYFVSYSIGRKRIAPLSSRPLILKYLILEETNDNLKEEVENANKISLFLEQDRGFYALPINQNEVQIDTNKKVSFLWSPFTYNERSRSTSSNHLSLKENNLWKLMESLALERNFDGIVDDNSVQSSKKGAIKNIIDKSYKILSELHRGQNLKKAKNTYKEEYGDYLRKIDLWEKKWYPIWGDRSTENISDFGIQWKNPLWFLNNIIQKRVSFTYGAIHGDLHPRNIVLSHHNDPCIIDFGWSNPNTHIIKDFVLMEANLRFVLLNPDVSFKDIQSLSRAISNQDILSFSSSDEYLLFIKELICLIRKKIESLNILTNRKDWTEQYEIPLFLVALGLLKYTKDIKNLISARLTVLSLATNIEV